MPSRSACPSPHPRLLTTSPRLRTGGVVSNWLPSLPQSSVQMPTCIEGWAGLWSGLWGEMPVGRRGSHRLCVTPAGSPGLRLPGQHPGVGGGVGLSSGRAGAGLEARSQTGKGATGGQCGRRDQDPDCRPTASPPRAVASTVGTWPDQVQVCGRPLRLPGSQLKRALVRVSVPASNLGDHVHLLWVELDHLEPTEAELEGEGTEVWEGDLGRGGSRARAPSQAVAPFLALGRQPTSGPCVHLCLHPAPQPPPDL